MAGRLPVTIVSIILLAGAILLQFFIVLSGDSYGNPLNRVYFLQSSTNGIPGARNPSRWTFFKICGVNDSDRNSNCGASVPALPFNPPGRSNFGTETGVPEQFIGTHKFYLLSRFMFAFLLISLVFGAIALLTSLLALCTRLGSYITALNTALAFFFQMLAAALMTAWVVKGRNIFRSAGQDTKIGTYAMGFVWASFASYFLATLAFCIGGGLSKRHRDRDSYASKRHSTGTFGRKGSTRSRGSFVNKEEYT